MISTHRTGPFPPLQLPPMPLSMPNLTRIILYHQTMFAGYMDSVVTYIAIVTGLVQRPNALNAKRGIIGH